MTWRRWLGLTAGAIALLLVSAWAGRAWLAGEIARAYLRSHGIASRIQIDSLGFSGVSGRFALGPAAAPDMAARHIEIRFDPRRWIPRVVEVRLLDPVVRARLDKDGRLGLGSLQGWLDSLPKGGGKSGYVSDDLAVSLSGLRALVATPAGALEMDGDIALARGLPVSASLRVRPATVSYKGVTVALKAARLSYDAAPGRLAAHVAADVTDGAANAQALTADMRADGLRWRAQGGTVAVYAPRARLKAVAGALKAGLHLGHPSLDLALSDVRVETGDGLKAAAGIAARARADLSLAIPATGDAALTRAVRRNLSHLDVMLAARVRHDKAGSHMVLSAPLTIAGAAGGKLTVPALALDGAPRALEARFDAALHGGGLPDVTASARDLVWAHGALSGALKIAARFDYAMLRGARLAGQGTVSWKDGTYGLAMKDCASVRLSQFRPGKVMAGKVSASLCPLAARPLLSGDERGWVLAALARGVSADATAAGVHLEGGTGRLDFHGGRAPQRVEGTVTVTAARIGDGARPVRFNPVAGSGTLALRGGIWRGKLAVTGKGGAHLADVVITHAMASGSGQAHIAAPGLTFDPGRLQPADLSPLLAAFRQAKGSARFDGEVNWNAKGLSSGGTLAVEGLDFLTPMGTAHAVKTKIAFTSLLPPQTAADQTLTIARIDWTLPLSAVDLRFGFDPKTIRVASIKAEFADGHAGMDSFAIRTADPGRIQGTVRLESITLSSLIAASNLGGKIQLDGKVGGQIPFTTGPEGLRIHGGHIVADGPGRLSINRDLWTQNGPAANAVQDFAYQALEHLAFDSLSADLNSIPGGRLQVLFHIKGRSDPPKPQTAEVTLGGLLDGSALRQPIPLPSGTPIDLTLDLSLNFDELLKSYADAWSKTLSPAPARSMTP